MVGSIPHFGGGKEREERGIVSIKISLKKDPATIVSPSNNLKGIGLGPYSCATSKNNKDSSLMELCGE